MHNNLPHNYPINLSIVTLMRNNPLEATFTRNSVFTSFSHRQDVEYLIYDGSDSPSVISTKDGQCSFYYHYHHCIDNGIYKAMNHSIDFVQGIWVLFIHSGDQCILSKVDADSLIDDLMSVKSSIVCGNGYKEFFNYGVSFSLYYKSNITALKSHMSVLHEATFVKRSLYHKYRYNTGFSIVSDYHFLLSHYSHISSTVIPYSIVNHKLDGISSSNLSLSRAELFQLKLSFFGRRVAYTYMLKSYVMFFVHIFKRFIFLSLFGELYYARIAALAKK